MGRLDSREIPVELKAGKEGGWEAVWNVVWEPHFGQGAPWDMRGPPRELSGEIQKMPAGPLSVLVTVAWKCHWQNEGTILNESFEHLESSFWRLRGCCGPGTWGIRAALQPCAGAACGRGAGGGRVENMAHFYIQIVILGCYILQKSRVLCQLHFNQIYNYVILSFVIRSHCFTLMHLQGDFILKIHGKKLWLILK